MLNELFNNKNKVIKEIETFLQEGIDSTDYLSLLNNIKEKKYELIIKMNKLLDFKLNAKTSDEAELYEDKYIELSNELESLSIEENRLQNKLSKDSSSKEKFALIRSTLESGEILLDGEFLTNVINKILVIDKENIVYLIHKNQKYKTEDIKLHIKRFLSLTPVLEGAHERTHNYKKYKLNYKVVII